MLVLALLGATAAAFAVTERLKLERSPITGTQVDRVFSPVCECARDVAVISFILRRRETVTLDMLNKNGRSIRTVVRKTREPAGRVSYTWDGRDNLDRVVPEGIYRPRVQLERNGRTIVLPNPIRVDTTAPRITLVRVFPRVFSPDSDGNRDRVTATYRIDERARAVMLVDGRQRVQSKFRALEGKLVWFGRVNGRVVRPGTYEIRLRAVDRAGNRSLRTRAGGFASVSSSSRASGSRRSQGSGSRCACAPTPTRTGGSSRDGEGSGGARCSSSARPTSRARTRSTSPSAVVRHAQPSRSLLPSERASRRSARRGWNVAPANGDEASVQREEVGPLGRDAR